MGSPILNPAPIRQPMFDGQGNLSRAWLIFFAQLFAVGGATLQNAQDITNITAQNSFSEDNNPVDANAIAEDVLRQTLPVPPRDFATDIEAALRLLIGDAPRVPTSDLEESRVLQASSDAPRFYASDLDELRSTAVWGDNPQLTNLGTAAYANTTAFDAAGAAASAQAAAESYSSNASNLSSGTVAVARGGTGASTASAALAALGGASLATANTFTGATNNFSTSGTPGVAAGIKLGYANAIASGSELQWWAGNTVTQTGAISHQLITANAITQGILAFKTFGSSLLEAMRLTGLQNVLIGSTTDNGADKLQVAGSVNATSYRVGGVAGVSGTITIPKLTTANGSITVTNGLITAFTNPT